MEEIKVGEYVRTNEGTIDKVIEIKDKKNILLKDNLIKTTISTHKIFISEKNVKNHSKNIIDLIEKGDFIFYTDEDGEKVKYIITVDYDKLDDLKEYLKKYCTIKSIVTKEQFADIEYRLED